MSGQYKRVAVGTMDPIHEGRRMRSGRLARALALGLLCAAAPAAPRAQAPGTGPLHILVGFAPGGSTDVVARLLAERIAQTSDRPVLVENRPGAGGRIAAGALKRATPDGSTVLLTPMVVIVLAPLVWRQLQYDPTKDFAPVAHLADFQIAFAVGADHPARTVPEFIAWAKARAARANFGTPSAGSQPHFFGVMIGRATGIDMVHVPYKGAAPLVTDLAGGRIPAGISALSDLLGQHRSGRLRIIATSGAQRSPLLPEVPSFKEQGFPAIEGTGWFAFYAPAGTPGPAIERWSTGIAAAVRIPEVRGKLVELGLEPTGTTPEQLAAIMAADTARWAPVVKASGFKGE